MGYRVRNQYGELKLESFEDLKNAFEKGLVEPDDEILETGSTHWRKVSSYPKLIASTRQRPSILSGPSRWYLLAGAMFLAGVGLIVTLRSGIVGFVIVLGVALLMSGVFTWMATRRRQDR
jgi:Flp pilus assembly protein TadB